MSAAKKEESFEKICTRLEQIVESLEDEKLELEESIKLFGEGVKLAAKARERLEESEKTVQKLSKSLEGKLNSRILNERV